MPSKGAGPDNKKAKSNPKLALSKSFCSALVTKVQLSDAEVDNIINTALKADAADASQLKD